MGYEFKDRCSETTTTTGTGTLSLSGAPPTGYRSLSGGGHTDGALVRYCISSLSQADWEVGEGVWTLGTNQLSRLVVHASSNSGALVSFAAGTKTVTEVMSAATAIVGMRASMRPDSYPTVRTTSDDEFEFGSSLDTAGARYPSAVPWTWLTSSATTAIDNGALAITFPASLGLRAFDQPVVGSSFKYRVKLGAMYPVDTSQVIQGMYFRNSGNQKCITLSRVRQSTPVIEFSHWTNLTTPTFVSTPASVTHAFEDHGEFKGIMYLELEYTGGNIIARVLRSGYANAARQISLETDVSFLGASPTHVGLVGSNGVATQQMLLYDWFRRY